MSPESIRHDKASLRESFTLLRGFRVSHPQQIEGRGALQRNPEKRQRPLDRLGPCLGRKCSVDDQVRPRRDLLTLGQIHLAHRRIKADVLKLPLDEIASRMRSPVALHIAREREDRARERKIQRRVNPDQDIDAGPGRAMETPKRRLE